MELLNMDRWNVELYVALLCDERSESQLIHIYVNNISTLFLYLKQVDNSDWNTPNDCSNSHNNMIV